MESFSFQTLTHQKAFITGIEMDGKLKYAVWEPGDGGHRVVEIGENVTLLKTKYQVDEERILLAVNEEDPDKTHTQDEPTKISNKEENE